MKALVRARHQVAVTAAVALLGTLGASPPTAQAQDTVQLRRNAEAQSRWAFQRDRTTRLKIDIRMGGQLVQSMDNREALHLAGETRVLEVREGFATTVQVAFAPTCKTQATQNGQPTATGPLPLAGKTYRIVRLGDGGLRIDGDQAPKDSTKEILKNFVDDPAENWFPPRPLRVGETWQAPEKAVRNAFDLKPGDRGQLTCTLAGLERGEDGRPTAKLLLEVTLQQKLQGMLDMVARLRGKATIDIQTGQALSLSLTGPLRVSGKQTQPGPNGDPVTIEFSGGGQLSTRSSARRLGGGPQPPNPLAGGPAPGQTPEQTPGQTQPPNPLGKGAGTPPAGGGWGRPKPKPPAGGGWDRPAKPAAPDLSTPEKAWEALSASLRGEDFAAFRSLHTARIRARLKESDFRSGKTMLQRYGLPPIGGFEPQPDQSVKITLQNGNVLTVLRKEDGGYRADTVWTR